MSELHPDYRPITPVSEPSDPAAELSAGSRNVDDPTQTFAYAFSADEGGDAADGTDSDPTVISSGTPLPPLASLSSWTALRPRDLGQLLEGRKLDHFQLDEFIGGGGMGAVFRASDTVLGRTVAVKVLAGGATGNEETRLRFQNEAQSAARLDHPNIARVHYVGEADGFKYIVFEYLEGKNLRDLVAEVGPLPLEDALNFTLQIAEALAHAWQRDIVHRDIKPSNVLATPEGQVKLVDMGLARFRDVTTNVEDLTASGVTLGTFDYISPEQARDPRSADIRSDIYSLGCTLYFMLCGRPPFQGGTAIQKLLMHQADEPPNPREYRPDLPAAIDQLLRRMLTKSPSERFQNPAELIAAIATLADDLGIPVHPTTTVQLTVSGQNSTWLASSLPWLIPAALLLVCVFLIDYLDRSAQVTLPVASVDTSDSPYESTETASSDRDVFSSGQEYAIGAGHPSTARAPASDPAPSGRNNARESISTSPLAEEVDAAVLPPLPSPTRPSATSNAAADQMLFFSSDWFAGTRTSPTELLRSFGELLRGSMGSGNATRLSRDDRPDGVIRNVTRRSTFATLADACADAQDRDVIEIADNGVYPIERDALPIVIRDKRITIRSAERTWPILQVITDAQIGRSGSATNVFEVENGTLRLEGLDVELTPRSTIDIPLTGWRILQLGLGGSAEIIRCSLTIRGSANAEFDMRNHDDFIRVIGRSYFVGPGVTSASEKIKIALKDVVVRGGDTLVSVEGDADIALKVDNGLIAVRRYLLDGPRREPRDQGRIEVDLEHVTADLGQGALRIRGGTRSDDFQAAVENCILVGSPDYALVEHEVEEVPPSQVLPLKELPLQWFGVRNVYSNWECIFRLHVRKGRGEIWLFNGWQEYWSRESRGRETGSTSSLQPVPWRSPPDATQPLAMRRPADYVLDARDQDLQALVGTDGILPGIIPERLPAGTASERRPPVEGRDGSTARASRTKSLTDGPRPAVSSLPTE